MAEVHGRLPGHVDDHDLEHYHLGMLADEAEFALLEEHLLWCGACVDRAEAVAQYVDAVRAAAWTALNECHHRRLDDRSLFDEETDMPEIASEEPGTTTA